jgi:hypothetical protein
MIEEIRGFRNRRPDEEVVGQVRSWLLDSARARLPEDLSVRVEEEVRAVPVGRPVRRVRPFRGQMMFDFGG